MSHPAHVLIGIGTRPEAIKVAPVYQELLQRPGIRPGILLTGQHDALVEQALALYGIDADVDLEAMTDRQGLPGLGSRILDRSAAYLREVRPDYVLVQGDTLPTFTVAWAAHLEGIPVGHIEAGLRSYDLTQPFPEESCRRMTDVISDRLHVVVQKEIGLGQSRTSVTDSGKALIALRYGHEGADDHFERELPTLLAERAHEVKY